jgi:aminodeoxyfutalosine synthase
MLMPASHLFQTDDLRVLPIKDKVLAGERLSEADALVLYGTGDILAVGWLANWVCKRKHGPVSGNIPTQQKPQKAN